MAIQDAISGECAGIEYFYALYETPEEAQSRFNLAKTLTELNRAKAKPGGTA